MKKLSDIFKEVVSKRKEVMQTKIRAQVFPNREGNGFVIMDEDGNRHGGVYSSIGQAREAGIKLGLFLPAENYKESISSADYKIVEEFFTNWKSRGLGYNDFINYLKDYTSNPKEYDIKPKQLNVLKKILSNPKSVWNIFVSKESLQELKVGDKVRTQHDEIMTVVDFRNILKGEITVKDKNNKTYQWQIKNLKKESLDRNAIRNELRKPEYWDKPKERDTMNEPELKKSKVDTLARKLSSLGVPSSITNNLFAGMKRSRIEFEIHNLKENFKESRFTRFASTDEQEDAIKDLERWASSIGKKIVGGTTIGKHPQSVVLDFTYQGGEVYIDSDGYISDGFDFKIRNAADLKKLLKESLKEMIELKHEQIKILESIAKRNGLKFDSDIGSFELRDPKAPYDRFIKYYRSIDSPEIYYKIDGSFNFNGFGETELLKINPSNITKWANEYVAFLAKANKAHKEIIKAL